MDLEYKLVKDFQEWAKKTQAGYGEDEADIWFEDIPSYDSLEWKVRELIREALTTRDAELREKIEEIKKQYPVDASPTDKKEELRINWANPVVHQALSDVQALLTPKK